MDFDDYTIGGETCKKSGISEGVFRIELVYSIKGQSMKIVLTLSFFYEIK